MFRVLLNLLCYVSCLLMDTNLNTAVPFLPRQGAMNPGGAFALNPHATSYVPLYKRVDHHHDMDGLLFANPTTQDLSFEGVQVSMPKISSEVAYKLIRDDDFDMEMEIDMDIEYLLVTFSGLSQESINDVYLANSGDLEATIEMLNQLEVRFISHLSYSFTCDIIVCHICLFFLLK